MILGHSTAHSIVFTLFGPLVSAKGFNCILPVAAKEGRGFNVTSKKERLVHRMSDSSSDTGDLDLSCSFSSVDSDQSEVSELEDTPGTIEPYQFEPLASESDSHTEPEADVVDDDDSGDDERLHSTNWWELACIYEPVDNNFTAMYLLYLTMYM